MRSNPKLTGVVIEVTKEELSLIEMKRAKKERREIIKAEERKTLNSRTKIRKELNKLRAGIKDYSLMLTIDLLNKLCGRGDICDAHLIYQLNRLLGKQVLCLPKIKTLIETNFPVLLKFLNKNQPEIINKKRKSKSKGLNKSMAALWNQLCSEDAYRNGIEAERDRQASMEGGLNSHSEY